MKGALCIKEDAKYLVGKVLSASSKGSPPGCWIDRVVAREELCVHVLVPSVLGSWTDQNYKTGSRQEDLREFHPMVPSVSLAGDWPVERVGGQIIARPSARKLMPAAARNSQTKTFHSETRNHPTKCMQFRFYPVPALPGICVWEFPGLTFDWTSK